MKISTVEEMRGLDTTATEKYGIQRQILMENAGHAVYSLISREFKIERRTFLIFCGSGNNGGDGFVVARKIHSNRGIVKIILLDEEKNFTEATKKNFTIISNLEIEIQQIKNVKDIKKEIERFDVIVDAIFGTGLSREITGIYKKVIELINICDKPIFSIDIPSGIHGNTGKIMGVAIEAKYTVTLGLPKTGNLLYPGFTHCGELYVSHLSFPPSLYNHLKIELNKYVELPKRREDGHKGDFGNVLFVAGAIGYVGAPYLSSMAFLKSGGGYSRLAAPKSVLSSIATLGCEVVYIPMKETEIGSLSYENVDKILDLTKKTDMVVIGPGLSLHNETQELVREISLKTSKPILIDGDGITALSSNIHNIMGRPCETILTPHLGEMAKLTKKSIEEIHNGKITILRNISEELNAIIVLKGAHSLIGYPDRTVFINMSGNDGMATAGSGDVLTGTIAAMVGLGLTIQDAVRTGVFIHGFSGDLAIQEKGKDGITATDILNYLPYAIKHTREHRDELIKEYSIPII
jgi:NAD(P)H-hydrate epimerase